jgi:hypothetical protein
VDYSSCDIEMKEKHISKLLLNFVYIRLTILYTCFADVEPETYNTI